MSKPNASVPCFCCNGSGRSMWYSLDAKISQWRTCDICGGAGRIEELSIDLDHLRSLDGKYKPSPEMLDEPNDF